MFVVTPVTTTQLSLTNPVTWTANEATRAQTFQAVSNVLALIARVESFSQRAAAVGYIPPDNPFTVIAGMNSARGNVFSRIVVSDKTASDLVYSIKVVINLIDAENQGAVDLTNRKINAAQLSHVRLSFDGFGGSGNPATDILRFLPDADAIKEEQARLALSVLDFSKRVPYILFTMEYSPVHGAPPVGTIIGWKKIADASGYIIKRRRVFSRFETEISLDNETLSKQSSVLLNYVKAYATTFFNNIDDSSIMVYLDTQMYPDEYIVYKVQAYQVQSGEISATLTIDSTPVSLTPSNKQSIKGTIASMDSTFTENNEETISPWPAFAQYLYGDSTYDWILAAVNTRASITRGDDRATTRKYSYLNAHSSFLFAQADGGKLVKPSDPNSVIRNITDSVQRYGVSQTIQNLFDETGISYYFEGRDAREDTHFDRAGTESVTTSNLFNVVASAIDPETAIVNLKTLAMNMATLLTQQLLDIGTAVQPGQQSSENAKPVEIAVPSPEEMTVMQAEGPLQYIVKLGDLRDSYADLTTFDGISKFMRVVRILSDFGPDKVPPGHKGQDLGQFAIDQLTSNTGSIYVSGTPIFRDEPGPVAPPTGYPAYPGDEFEIDKGITRPPVTVLPIIPTPVRPPPIVPRTTTFGWFGVAGGGISRTTNKSGSTGASSMPLIYRVR
jgi:hypothetical protein